MMESMRLCSRLIDAVVGLSPGNLRCTWRWYDVCVAMQTRTSSVTSFKGPTGSTSGPRVCQATATLAASHRYDVACNFSSDSAPSRCVERPRQVRYARVTWSAISDINLSQPLAAPIRYALRLTRRSSPPRFSRDNLRPAFNSSSPSFARILSQSLSRSIIIPHHQIRIIREKPAFPWRNRLASLSSPPTIRFVEKRASVQPQGSAHSLSGPNQLLW